ncbi:MAG TPA: SIR2 family protein [Nostocaceae cyanobacterium]|nr:SIR2 family protein [Nostocaceae cyanobacterium]
MAGITWLHLSDWHQQGITILDRRVVRDALIRDIEERENISPDLAKIDFIIFSGDVAYSGKKEEYEAAREYLFDPVLKATGLSTKRLFIIPGNHDLDRTAFELLPEPILKHFEGHEQVTSWLTNERKREHLREPFEAYRQFVRQYTHQNQPDYSSISRFVINGRRVGLLGLNSALIAGRKDKAGDINDYGKLIVGECQLYDALQQMASDELRIAVLHHPLEWLAEFERDRLVQLLQDSGGCHILLCGHQHKSQVVQVTGTTGNCVIIPAGSIYEQREYANGYNFVHLDLDNKRGTVYLRRWSPTKSRWIQDIESADDSGKVSFSLPQKVIVLPSLTQREPDKTLEAKVKLETHFKKLVGKIKEGLVIPFLGADINLCDRLKFQDPFLLPWSWDVQGDYPPTSVELAAYLDERREYLATVRCPLYEREALPTECPLITGMTEFVTRLDLQNVSQYFNIQGETEINNKITEVAKHRYKPNHIHRFLAELPRLMDKMGYFSRIRSGMASDSTRYQLIVTTNFDSTLEQAFVDAKQPFDLVSYTVVGDNNNSQLVKEFVHQRFEHEVAGDQESPIVQIGEVKPILPGISDKILEFSLNERPLILKLYGPVDWPEYPQRGFVITEDHFIDYLAYGNSDPTEIFPKFLLDKLRNNYILFLGYTLRYWHQRVILHRIWPETESRTTEKWCAVHPKPDDLDKSLWMANDVELISEMSLEKYVEELETRLKQPILKSSLNH